MRFTNKSVSRKAAAITVASALTIFGGAGAALAYWTTTGAGSGSAAVASSNGTVVLSSAPISGLIPGGPSSTQDINAANTGSTDLAVGDVTVTMSAPGFNDAALRALGVSATVVDNTAVALHGATTKVGDVTVLVANDPDHSQDALKGLSITLTYAS
jgi:hypothetical protein